MAAALVVVAAVLVAYAGALSAGFVLDDYHLILEHRELGVRLIPGLWWRAYESGNAAFYRPLSTGDFAIDRSLFGLSAAAFHAHNLAWHLAATASLAWMLRPLLSARATFLATLLFALHPVHTEAVAGVVGRSELMAATLVFLGCRLQLDGRRGLAALAYFAALASKESGVMLPACAVLLELARLPPAERRWPDVWRRARAALVRAWPMGIALVAYVALRVHALAGATLPPPAEYFLVASRAASTLTALDVLGRELALLVWPHPLCADYSYPAIAIGSVPRAALTVAALVVLVLAARRGRALFVGFALGWLGLTILPVSNLVVHIGVLMAERLLYLPSVAVCVVGGAALALLYERARPFVAHAAAAAIVVTLALVTMARVVDWQTPLSLWRDTVTKQPRSALAHGNLALSCEVVGDRDCADQELQQAVALDPERVDFREALARLRALP